MKKLAGISLFYVVAWCAVFFFLRKFGVHGDYVTSITAAAVGYFAYLVYELGQIDRLRAAAKILVLDVRNAEDALSAIRGGANYSAWSKVSLVENNWSKHKQNFVGVLNTDEFRSFEYFFHAWSELAVAKKRFEDAQFAGIMAKSEYVQHRLLDLDQVPDAEREPRRLAIIATANQEQFLFEPGLPQQQLTHYLSSLSPLSGTTGLEKLRRIAGLR